MRSPYCFAKPKVYSRALATSFVSSADPPW